MVTESNVPTLLSPQEFAERLRVSRHWVYKLVERGLIVHYRVGVRHHLVRIPESELTRLVALRERRVEIEDLRNDGMEG